MAKTGLVAAKHLTNHSPSGPLISRIVLGVRRSLPGQKGHSPVSLGLDFEYPDITQSPETGSFLSSAMVLY
jgi:hypothetical protein